MKEFIATEILPFFVMMNIFFCHFRLMIMESKGYKGTKNDFSHFITMALQDRMPWNILSFLLKRLAPTLNETREIICILLTELEALQSTLHDKEKEIENYHSSFEEKTGESEQVEDQDDHSIQTETNVDNDLVEQGKNEDISFEVKVAQEFILYEVH